MMSRFERVAVLGAGGMGTAVALLLSRVVGDVRLWSRDCEHAAELEQTRSNERHLPGVVLPEAILVTSQAGVAAAEVDLMVAAVPTSYLRATFAALAEELPAATSVLSVVKGIEYGSFARRARSSSRRWACGPSRCFPAPAMRKSWRKDCRRRWWSLASQSRSTCRCTTCSATKRSASTPAPTRWVWSLPVRSRTSWGSPPASATGCKSAITARPPS